MSSTLFARGVNSQVGMKRRSDDMNNSISLIKNELILMKQTSDEVYVLKSVISSLTEKIANMQKTIDELVVSVAAAPAPAPTPAPAPSITITKAVSA